MKIVKTLIILLLLGSSATAGETKIRNSRGQITATVKQSGNTLYFRDAQGRYTGKAVVQPSRVIQYDARGRRK